MPNFVPAIHILINYNLTPKELDFTRFLTKSNADTYLFEVKAGALTFSTGTSPMTALLGTVVEVEMNKSGDADSSVDVSPSCKIKKLYENNIYGLLVGREVKIKFALLLLDN